MEADDLNSIVSAVWTFGVGGTALGAGFLWLEHRAANRFAGMAAGLLAIVLSLGAVALWATDQPATIVIAVAALGLASLAAWALHSAAARRWATRLANPRIVWGLLLLLCPLSAFCLTRGLDRTDPLPENLERIGLVGERVRVPSILAETDQGRQFALFAMETHGTSAEEEERVLSLEYMKYHVIRLSGPDDHYNCHGWVFTKGQYAVASEDVDTILSDNGYQEVQQPQEGDVIVYCDGKKVILHTGLVQSVLDDLILIESKWGPLGLYLHPPEAQPYGTLFHYYRSPRKGHLLTFVETKDSDLAAEPPAGSKRPRACCGANDQGRGAIRGNVVHARGSSRRG